MLTTLKLIWFNCLFQGWDTWSGWQNIQGRNVASCHWHWEQVCINGICQGNCEGCPRYAQNSDRHYFPLFFFPKCCKLFIHAEVSECNLLYRSAQENTITCPTLQMLWFLLPPRPLWQTSRVHDFGAWATVQAPSDEQRTCVCGVIV